MLLLYIGFIMTIKDIFLIQRMRKLKHNRLVLGDSYINKKNLKDNIILLIV